MPAVETSTETSTTETTYRPFLDLLVEGRVLPDGYDTFGYKMVRPDLRTFPVEANNGERFRWPFPGHTVHDNNAVVSEEVCPTPLVGGFAVAKTLRGARDGQHGHATILLLAYNRADVLAENEHKIRVRGAIVVDVLNGAGYYMKAAGHDLSGANLSGANLAAANLAGANLSGALLQRARLEGADMSGANLTDAQLTRANCRGVNFDGANVQGAKFDMVDLRDTTGTAHNVAGASTTDAKKSDVSPFTVIKVPRGRTDIGQALQHCGVPFTYDDAPSRRY